MPAKLPFCGVIVIRQVAGWLAPAMPDGVPAPMLKLGVAVAVALSVTVCGDPVALSATLSVAV